jgi:hypothetical protein
MNNYTNFSRGILVAEMTMLVYGVLPSLVTVEKWRTEIKD